MNGGADLAFLGQVHEVLAEHQRLLRQRGEHDRAEAVKALALDAFRRAQAAAFAARVPVLMRTGPERHQFAVGDVQAPRRWESRGAGAQAVALAAMNPHKWLTLPADRSRRAWALAIGQAVESIALVDLNIANLLAPARRQNGPGIRLREHEGKVEMRWTPPPGVATLAPRLPLGCLT